MENRFIRTFVSVDCVIFGFASARLHVLLVERNIPGHTVKSLKLPGSLIYQQEDADEGAKRVLCELTGIKKMTMRQFKCFTSPSRTANSQDMDWVKSTYNNQVDRLITIAYLSLCKIDRRLNMVSKYQRSEWVPVESLPIMPFDHNQIVEEALQEIRTWVEKEPAILFALLPQRFTASELRRLFEAVYHKHFDVRNFHKKIAHTQYIVPLDYKEENVAHRAARYYKFDRVLYNKHKKGM